MSSLSIWKPVPGYESTYRVSRDGIVERLPGFWCRTHRPLLLHISNSGHLRVSLSTRGNRNSRKLLVHRIVYEAFRGPIPTDKTVNHRNGDKQDNRLGNLELATMSQQMVHAYSTGLQSIAQGEARGRVAKLTEAEVREIRCMYKPRVVTYTAIARQFGVSQACVLMIVKRRRWPHI